MATKYREITIRRTRVIEEAAVLDIAEDELRGMTGQDLVLEASKHGCYYEVDSVVTHQTSEDTTGVDESADSLGDISDISDDGEP